MKFLLQILFVFFCHATLAQSNSVWFDEVLDETGSSIHGVAHILQDRDGFIWLCHSDGISKFDGYYFKHYSKKELMTPFFKSKTANLVFEDKSKNLWIVTDAGALMQYQYDVDQFKLMSDTTQLIEGTAYSFAEDDDGNFWFGSAGGGLYKFNVKNRFFKKYSHQGNDTASINNNYVIALTFDNKKQLWIGTTNGLCRYVPERDAFQRVKLANSNPMDTYRFRVIRSLLFSHERLFIGTYGGLHCLDLKTKKSRHYFHNQSEPNSLSHNSIFKLQEDHQKNIWIATYGGGINRFDPSTQEFTSWKGTVPERGKLHTDNLFTLYFDHKGRLWAGGADAGVFLHNPDSKKIYSVGNSPYDSGSISPGWVRSIFQENDSIIWIGFNGSGVNKYNIKSGKVVSRYVNDPTDATSLSHNAVLAIDKDNQGNLWFGSGGGGVNKLNKESGRFTRYMFIPKKNSIANNAVATLLVDEDLMWITTYISGLDVFNFNTNTFYHFSEDSLKSLGISFAKTDKILKHDGNIWFTTHQGIVVFDKTKKIFVKIPDAHGDISTLSKNLSVDLEVRPYTNGEILVSNNFSEIWKISYANLSDFKRELLWKDTLNISESEKFLFTADPTGNLWINKESNLTRFDFKKNEISTFNVTNKITDDRRLNGIFAANDERIFLTGANGFIWFYPHEIKNDSTPVKVVLTGLDIFNEPALVQETDTLNQTKFHLPKHISSLTTLELHEHQNFFSFHFAALTFTDRDKIQYAYQLEGFDRDWVYAGNRKYASYTNLDPGKYIFKVKATNPDGYWNSEATSLEVVILPPFWKTGWFIAFAFLFGCSLIYTLHRYRVAQSLKVERLRNKIASDLHDEVGSSLTRISIYSDLLQNGIEAEERKNYLAGIGELSREVVSTMSDIVWSIDNRHDTLGALILRMKDFAAEVLQTKGIELQFLIYGVDENKTLDPALKQNIYLIFKESVNNIVKHAKARRVNISLQNEGHEFKMVIKDDGCGFIQNGKTKGNGVRNMQRRARTVQAEFEIQNHEGTTLILKRKAL